MPRVLKRFSEILSVQGNSEVGKFNWCGGSDQIKVPKKYSRKTTKNTDLVIFTKVEASNENWLAYAGACQIGENNRPVAGLIVINSNYISTTPQHVEQLSATLIHEIAHILAISPGLYDIFNTSEQVYIKENQVINGKTVSVYKITTPKVLQAAKEHFECPSLTGVYLENEGGSGSAGAHFEKVHYGNEMMTAQDVGLPALSAISLALFEDSGWYKANYSFADPLIWGKGQGCGFLNVATCSSGFLEYCNVEKGEGCSADYLAKTVCSFTGFGDNCLINNFLHRYECGNTIDFIHTSHNSQGGNVSLEQPGKFSRCFETMVGNFKRSGCFESKCVDGDVVVTAGGIEYVCESDGQDVVVGDFVLTCPDREDFCGRIDLACEEDCNGNGRCLEGGMCYCDHFHFGEFCKEDRVCKGKVFCKDP